MINTVREWLTGIIAATLLTSAAQILMPSENVRKIGAFTGGLILMAALLGPLYRMGGDWPEWNLREYEREIERRETELREQGNREFAAQVAEQTRTLIIARAAELGIDTNAAVRTDMDDGIPVPCAAEMDCPRNAVLETWIAAELGIPPESQTWAGSP